jgi:hypothetical protein
MTAQPLPTSRSGRHPLGTVYLLHFDQRYEHAGHYCGKPASSGLLKAFRGLSGGEFGELAVLVRLVDLVERAELEAVADRGRLGDAEELGELEGIAAGGVDLGQQPVGAQVLGGEAQLLEHLLDMAAGDWGQPAGGALVDQQVGVGAARPAGTAKFQPGAQRLVGEAVQAARPTARQQRAGGHVDVGQGEHADLVRAQGVDAGQQYDQPPVWAVKLVEQAGTAGRVKAERRRWRLAVDLQPCGGVGEDHPAGLEGPKQRAHRRRHQPAGRPGEGLQLLVDIVAGDLAQRGVARRPVGQGRLGGAQVTLDGGGLAGRPARGPRPRRTSVQVWTSPRIWAGSRWSRRASQWSKVACWSLVTRSWSARNSTTRSAVRCRSIKNRRTAAASIGEVADSLGWLASTATRL